MAYPGYAGTILRVDLSTGKISKDPLPDELVRDYLGGRGFVARLLWDEVPAGAEPYGPENRVIFASGPLAGVFVPAGGKVELGTKSPASNGYGDSNMGGHIAAEMRYAGYDVIIFSGQADKPTYLFIDNERVELRDAAKYWGMGSISGEKQMKTDLGEDFQIALIGPAGENRVNYACVSHDYGRQAGRTGIGGVMGSKNLKAVAVRGNKNISAYDMAKVDELGHWMFKHCAEAPALKEWQDYGTASVTSWVNTIGCFPVKNFSDSFLPGYEVLSGEVMRERIVVTDKSCFGCPMSCGKYSHGKVKTAAGEIEFYVEGPEYETTAVTGANNLITDITQIAYLNFVLDELGLDTISGGSTIAFALECIEKGIITPDQVEGKDLRFGDLESVLWLAEKIAKREGIGDLLADGTRAASRVLGGGSEAFAIQVKGLEMSGYESRNAPAMLLSYMTADIGAAHNRSWAVTHDLAEGREKLEGKAARVVELQHIRPVFDTLGACRLQWVELAMPLEKYAEMFAALTGIPYSWADMEHVAEREFNLTRAFSIRENPDYGRQYDMPPARVYTEVTPGIGPSAGTISSLEAIDYLLDDYYSLRGWTSNGIPTGAKLQALGLADVAKVIGAV
jgi:aldehyde:ferredoxin oxidoreductase